MGTLGKFLFDVDQVELRDRLNYGTKAMFTPDEETEDQVHVPLPSLEDEVELQNNLFSIPEPMRICAVPMVGMSSSFSIFFYVHL